MPLQPENLLAISPLDGRYAAKTLPLQEYFSEYALFKFRFEIEVKWLAYLLAHAPSLGLPSPDPTALESLLQKSQQFDLADAMQIKVIEQQCNHDVKAVEYFLKNYLSQQPQLAIYQEWVHFGCTSEDINNLAYALMIKNSLQQIIIPKLERLATQLTDKAHTTAEIPMLARTHGQAATPTTVGKEFANFVYRLKNLISSLKQLPICAKFNGAVGNYNAQKISVPAINWPEFNQIFVEQLGLIWNPYTTQIEPHDYLAEILHKISSIHSVLIDLARDCWGYISLGYFDQRVKAEEIGSSTMPHKINPIDFENAEGNLSVSQALAQFLAIRLPISRYQRDLVDSTLLRNIGSVFAYALISYDSLCNGLEKISPNLPRIAQDLNGHAEILAEAIQTVMRFHGLALPYEQLKSLTRGQRVDLKKLHGFIAELTLPELIKEQLLTLKPEDYLGYAAALAKKI